MVRACVQTRYFSLLLVLFNGVDVSQNVLLPPFERSLEQQGNVTQPTARGGERLSDLPQCRIQGISDINVITIIICKK